LLAGKLALAATVPQKTRQEVAHLKILVPCVRAFLNEFLQRVERGEIPARHWLGAANQVLKLTSTRRAKKNCRPARDGVENHPAINCHCAKSE